QIRCQSLRIPISNARPPTSGTEIFPWRQVSNLPEKVDGHRGRCAKTSATALPNDINPAKISEQRRGTRIKRVAGRQKGEVQKIVIGNSEWPFVSNRCFKREQVGRTSRCEFIFLTQRKPPCRFPAATERYRNVREGRGISK